MRVWHFVNEQYGLDDLKKKRLKIATLQDLNDPFELFSIDFKDERLRRAVPLAKQMLAQDRGILCFSKTWNNPVQWSHYADKHRGLCLGFDVPDQYLRSVSYSRKRLIFNADRIFDGNYDPQEVIDQFLFTKYSHWRYENEVRCFVTLEDREHESGLYFKDFSDTLRLATVIVGAESKLSRSDLNAAMGDLAPSVESYKARLAFSSFRVVRQKKSALWK